MTGSRTSGKTRFFVWFFLALALGGLFRYIVENVREMERRETVARLNERFSVTAGNAGSTPRSSSVQEVFQTYDSIEGKLLPFFEILQELGYFLAAAVAVHAAYFFFIKTEEKTEEESSLAEMRAVFHEEVHSSMEAIFGGVHKWGFVRFHERFDRGSVFKNLKAGDELCWLDAGDPGSDALDSLRIAATEGVKIRVLALQPGSEVAEWRSLEVQLDRNECNRRIQSFIDGVRSVVSAASQSRGVPVPPQSEWLRQYADLPAVPMCIVRRINGEVSAYTGFFLNKKSSHLPYIEWSGRADTGELLVRSLCAYYEDKWKRWEKPRLPDCKGRWEYYMQGEDNSRWTAQGTCSIGQRGRTAWLDGWRHANDNHQIPPLHWRSIWSEVCPVENEREHFIVRMDYTIDSATGEGPPHEAFARVKIEEIRDGRAQKMSGHYFMLKHVERDIAVASRFGRLTLVKLPEDSSADGTTL